MKAHIWRYLADAVEAVGLPWDVYPGGMAVEVDRAPVYEPDALVRCGPRLPDDAAKLNDPVRAWWEINESLFVENSRRVRVLCVGDGAIIFRQTLIVVEGLSPSTRARDLGARNADDTILTRIVRDGTLHLDPPGLMVNGRFPAAG